MRWDRLFQWLYPARCVLCRTDSAEVLCKNCEEALPRLPEGVDPFMRSVFFYRALVRKLVHQMKFQRKKDLGRYLGQMMACHLKGWTESIKPLDVILPVPTTLRTERHRSFNQAETLGLGFSEVSKIPIRTGILVRRSQQAHQYRLTAKEREENMQKAFAISRDGLDLLPRCPRILIIDDVYTTGATIRACTRALCDGGVPSHAIFVATLARVYNSIR